MKPTLPTPNRFRREGGLTLIEILVSSALLLVITLGLTAMFNQTQRAFQTGLRNADVYEGSRATMDLISRDMEQLGRSSTTNLHIVTNGCLPIAQMLPDGSTRMHQFCFLAQINNRWTGIGYKLTNSNGVGMSGLMRFATNYSSSLEAGNLVRDFDLAWGEQLRPVCDGVVHFRVIPFSTNGYPPYDLAGLVNISSFPQPGTFVDPATNYFDFANCVPGYVQLEMAVLEPQTLEQVKGLPSTSQLSYLASHVNRVHVFRQQIPIRAAQR
ncbi:MAG: hypothetical protein JWM68_5050 [Verrucomicrobiales bacterium]|nr:hypothetical protein [Verrucomicrobiales bacterium]